MNERVKELRDEILAEAYQKQQGMDWVMEKFAEYLIKKCAMIGNHAYDGGGYNAGQMIREHFGVEE